MKKRKVKKPSKTKLWNELSKSIREHEKRCAICGSDKHLNVHHLLSKKFYPEYLLEPQNLIVLCAKHHQFGRNSAHKNGVFFTEWLRIHRRKQLTWCIKAMLEHEKHLLKNEN